MSVVRLVPIYCGSHAELLGPLSRKLEEVFRMPVERHPPGFDPEEAFDASRGQYDSRRLLAKLLAEAPGNSGRVLGVTSVDLFIPVLTFVFGEAQLEGPAAVVSTHRLAAEMYGLPAQPQLLFDRLCKEAIHELGHTYRLVHCHRHKCVMLSSPYVESIDQKSERFCEACLQAVRSNGRQE